MLSMRHRAAVTVGAVRALLAIAAILVLLPARVVAQPVAPVTPLEQEAVATPLGQAAVTTPLEQEAVATPLEQEAVATSLEHEAVTPLEQAVTTPLEQEVIRTPIEQEVLGTARSAFAREVLTQLYAARSWQPLWTDKAKALELVASVRDVGRQGLDPKSYALAEIEPLVEGERGDPRRDALLSRSFVRLAFDLRFGRIPTSGFTAAHAKTKKLAQGDNAAELAAAIERGQVHKFLTGLQPPIALYQRLATALERYRKIAAAGGWQTVAAGAPLQPGGRDLRVPAIRERLAAESGVPVRAEADSTRYEGDLVEAVRAFQVRHGLERDGVIGRRTVEAMNVTAARRVEQIRATMERTRQFLHDLPERFVVVNFASFSAYLIDKGQPAWSTRIIVGTKEKETPVFRASIESFTINPEWNVPESIVREELLPGLARDPKKLEKMHIRRVGNRYVQEGGSHNSLGRIKFNMPNEHAVYLHDTPSKALFDRRERAFSHGCVRTEHPFVLAALLLAEPGRDAAALEKEAHNGKTRTFKLREPVPVLVTTWSVVVAADGRVDFLPDIYGQDDDVLLGLDGKTAGRSEQGTAATTRN